MNRLALGTLGAALALSTIAASRMGGWAVVSVENVPEYVVAGKPLVLSFVVRQHGHNELEGLRPAIVAKSGRRVVEGRAWESQTAGSYRASVTVPQPGEWEITIESGFGSSKGRLAPLRAIDSTQQVPAALAAADRGRQLFAAKGCVSCHVHSAVAIEPFMKDVAPELSDRRFAVDYLAKFLADPSIKPQTPVCVINGRNITLAKPSERRSSISSAGAPG